MKSYEIRKGHKKIYGVERPGGVVRVMVDCDVVPQVGMLVLSLTVAQAEAVFSPSRGCIQDILPDVAPALREVFVCGVTPLEWARDVEGGAEALAAAWDKYKAHYEIDEEIRAAVEASLSGVEVGA